MSIETCGRCGATYDDNSSREHECADLEQRGELEQLRGELEQLRGELEQLRDVVSTLLLAHEGRTVPPERLERLEVFMQRWVPEPPPFPEGARSRVVSPEEDARLRQLELDGQIEELSRLAELEQHDQLLDETLQSAESAGSDPAEVKRALARPRSPQGGVE